MVRLALVSFTPTPEGWREWGMQFDDVEVAPISVYETDGGLKVLVGAAQVLDYRPKVTTDNEVVIPSKQRKTAEEAIEVAANLIAVAQGCRRSISSPWPPVVFVANGDAGHAWLAERAGIQHGDAQATMRASEQMNLDESALQQLGDRPDGVALLVEALSHDHATGRFHELIRLFERAFAAPAKKLTGPVAATLDPQFGYTEEEVKVWFEQLRDPATHADARNEFLLEADVRPVIGRMEQAALDMLMNKDEWRQPSTTRREVWRPAVGTSDSSGGVFLTEGKAASLQAHALDEYGAFPLDLGGVIKDRPANWWPQNDAKTTKTQTSTVEIVAPADGTIGSATQSGDSN